MILSRKILKSVGDSRHPCRTLTVVRNQSPMLLLKITALVALSYRCSMVRTSLEPMLYFLMVARMPYLIKCLLEIYEDMIQALLMLKVFLAKDSKVEDLFTGAPSCSKTRMFFSDDIFCLRFESVE